MRVCSPHPGAFSCREEVLSNVIESELKSLVGDRAVDRRTFVVSSLSAGFALAVLPVSAQTITTSAEGLVAGEVKVPAKGGDMVAYRAMPATGGPFPTMLVVSVTFEFAEFVTDSLFGWGNFYPGVDTLGDVIFDVAGIVTAAVVISRHRVSVLRRPFWHEEPSAA